MAPERTSTTFPRHHHPAATGTTGTGSGSGITIISRFHSSKKQNQTSRPQLSTKFSNARSDNGLIALRYEDSLQAKPPIPVTVAPPRSPPQEQHPAFRRPIDGLQAKLDESRKRDSGLAPTTTSSNRGTSITTVDDYVLGVVIDFNTSPSLASLHSPTMEQPKDLPQVPDPPSAQKKSSFSSDSRWRLSGSRKNSDVKAPGSREQSPEDFAPIMTPIPTDSLLDDGFIDTMSFSKRGSIMFGGKKAVNRPNAQARLNVGRR